MGFTPIRLLQLCSMLLLTSIGRASCCIKGGGVHPNGDFALQLFLRLPEHGTMHLHARSMSLYGLTLVLTSWVLSACVGHATLPAV